MSFWHNGPRSGPGYSPVAATHTKVAAIAGRIFTAAVTVPTQSRGDLLATVEATYADGTNAGSADGTNADPADWTQIGRAHV